MMHGDLGLADDGETAVLADRNVAVLVSDLSGFTSTTRKHGIVHFASIIVRMRQLCLPILHNRGLRHLTTEADNFIVIFEDVCEAAMAAVEMKQVIQAYNDALTPERDHYKIKLNGVGLHCGTGVSVDAHGRLFGATASLAYAVGEDVCSKGSIILSETAKEVVCKHANFSDAGFEECSYPQIPEPLYEIKGTVSGLDYAVVPTTDMEWLHPNLGLLVSRHDPDADVAKVDEKLREDRMQELTALMFGFDIDQSHHGAEEQASSVKAFELVRPILLGNNGMELEECLYVFKNPADAVVAAVALRNIVAEHVDDGGGKLVLSGCGVHTGNVLFIEGTDIHWGDPVNTASKLGEDLAEDGDIFITAAAYELAKDDARLGKLTFTARTLQTSKVEFNCFAVTSAF